MMKIALFDSGIGGLSVLQAFLAQQLPAQFHYVADSAHVPYGIRDKSYIDHRLLTLFQYLYNEVGIDLFVIACNTATATSAEMLRRRYPHFPIIGVEPAVKPASLSTKSGHIIVAATESTLQSERLSRLIATYSQQINVHKLSGGRWVELVEAGDLHSTHAQQVIEESLRPFQIYPVDQFILGCTHFPFLIPTLSQLLPPEVTLINPAKSIATHAISLLKQQGDYPPSIDQIPPAATTHFYTTGDLDHFHQQLKALHLPITTLHTLPL